MSQSSGGIMSSGGLVRYFDSEDSNAIFINHKSVLIASAVIGLVIQLAHFAL